ncbi:MAG: coproporphyrinogen dehydrogenase HemZ [Lachnospiraceae bacterium]|nr:coproporphyrinogen dehydrogenase HemZ [Lachnospiraceae bacterium]MCI9185716.1 coproporphyrinogen dehydrogenase HemZ [Lachnospiraceae bacterium]
MIGILLNDNAYEQDIRELLMAFFPGEDFVYEAAPALEFCVSGILNQERTKFQLQVIFRGKRSWYLWDATPAEKKEWDRFDEPIPVDYENRTETKNKIKRRLYVILRALTGRKMPWGSLTGIRPVKIALTRLGQGMAEEEIQEYMKDTYFASEEKIRLCLEIARKERALLGPALGGEGGFRHDGYSLYVGIPFCPTTCLYCSFTSYPIGKWGGRVQEYLAALFQELEYVARTRGRRPSCVYVGGGTPTSLTAEDLEKLLDKLTVLFDCGGAGEFTVEAGRPDSITGEKLKVLKKYGVSRISINPQTMNQKTLDLIGRCHKVEEVEARFYLARELGFDNINMDLIVGLPGEDLVDVQRTMDSLRELSPDSLTVHCLAIKRAARLNTMKEAYKDYKIVNSQGIVEMTARYARKMGLEPYYLYRQKNMAGNFENVGYALPGKECLYNILIMEEQQTIVGCGAGTTTKRLIPGENRIERAETVKNVEQYIGRVGEMIERKERLFG